MLVISPYFPPTNAADMQRIRMSLPYFEQYGWEAEVVTVDPAYSDLPEDGLLLQTVPADIRVHQVKAFNKKWTAKFGLGSIALRSLFYYRKRVNQLLQEKKYDLIYFSTTQFPVCILGPYWRKRFGIPYVIDMQDPWHSEYYRDKPKEQRPSKYWFSYRLNKYLERIAMRHVDGLISVSNDYIDDLKARYPWIQNIPSATITFGGFAADMGIATDNRLHFQSLVDPLFTNIVYVGRGGHDMHKAISALFSSLKKGLEREPHIFKKIKVFFIGTSYAPQGKGRQTVAPLADQFGLGDSIIEITDRISFYHALVTLQQADALFIPGSDDPKYSASKLYPYLLSGKPVLAIFNSMSPALKILRAYQARYVYAYDSDAGIEAEIDRFLRQAVSNTFPEQRYNEEVMAHYSAQNMSARQCELFDRVIASQLINRVF